MRLAFVPSVIIAFTTALPLITQTAAVSPLRINILELISTLSSWWDVAMRKNCVKFEYSLSYASSNFVLCDGHGVDITHDYNIYAVTAFHIYITHCIHISCCLIILAR